MLFIDDGITKILFTEVIFTEPPVPVVGVRLECEIVNESFVVVTVVIAIIVAETLNPVVLKSVIVTPTPELNPNALLILIPNG